MPGQVGTRNTLRTLPPAALNNSDSLGQRRCNLDLTRCEDVVDPSL